MFWVWIILLALLSAAVKGGFFAIVDLHVSTWIEAVWTPAGGAAARALTFFGSTPWTLVAVVVMGVWWWRRNQRSALAAFLGAGAVGLIIQAGLRLWVGQWRPDVETLPAPSDLIARYELAGFTSGHGFRSAFLYGWWGRALWERRAAAGALGCGLLILAVGATRVYLQRHWLSDVLGSWLVALVALSCADLIRAKQRETG